MILRNVDNNNFFIVYYGVFSKIKSLIFIVLVCALATKTLAQEVGSNAYFLAKVVNVEEAISNISETDQLPMQLVTLDILSGEEKGNELLVEHGKSFSLTDSQRVKSGDTVVVVKTFSPMGTLYFIGDKFRLPYLGLILLIFVVTVVGLSRLKGLNSFIGLLITIFILVKFIVPQILAGHNPLAIALIGAVITAFFSLYMAHGLNIRTTLSLASTLLALGASALMAVGFVNISKLFGTGSEEAFYLMMRTDQNLNLKGILLAGIIIGALGVLDDITTAQTATVDEIKKANPSLTFTDLYKRGISVGHEHISSLVNTLVLAYAGASMPLFLIFSVDKSKPLWVILNSEYLAEEVIRTLVGSITLVLAVPLSTLIAAWYFTKYPSDENDL